MGMLKNGDEIGGYKIAGELGRGGMGAVYRAHDKALQRDAALKMVLAEQATPQSKRRFLREAAAIARCDHPGIVKVYSFGEHGGLPYMAMELVDCRTRPRRTRGCPTFCARWPARRWRTRITRTAPRP